MKDGDKLKLRGSGGALFVVTVGQPFTRDLIERRLKAGEWSWPGDEPQAVDEGEPEPRTGEKSKPAPGEGSTERGDADADPDRPAQSAPKAEWVAYAARTQHMSREDAANYTKADLIDMVS